jgi:hypothetical protein
MLTIDPNHLGVSEGDRVLDVGCGEGRHLRGVHAHADVRSVGLDLDPERLAATRAGFDDLGVVAGHGRGEHHHIRILHIFPSVPEKQRGSLFAQPPRVVVVLQIGARHDEAVVQQHLAPRQLVLVGHLEGDVVDGPGARPTAGRLRVFEEVDDVPEVAGRRQARAVALAVGLLVAHRSQQRRRRLRAGQRQRHAEEAADGVLGGDGTVRRVTGRCVCPADELQRESVGVLERDHRITEPFEPLADSDARVLQSVSPIVHRVGGDEELRGACLSSPDLARASVLVREERHTRPRRSPVITVEEVIDGDVVLVDALFDQPQT